MDKIKAMQTFVRIVEANSFSKAAETLNLPRASLTATMQNLEAFLDTRLLQRTTRRLSLTPDGAQYYKECLAILNAVEAAELSFRGPDAKRPKGTLRVDLPGALGRNFVLPRISEFCTAYPEVNLSLSLTDRLVDIMQEGIDCAVRVGHLQDSSMVGRQIGIMRFVTCAAPPYLDHHGIPHAIEDLQSHKGVVHFSGRTGRAFDWKLVVDGKPLKVDFGGSIAVDDADGNVSCALQGLGLAQAAIYQVRKHLEDGTLVQVLPDWPPTDMPISLLYPQGRMATPKLRVFADWLRTLFDTDPALQLQA